MRPRQARAARLNPARGLVTGTVCDVRVEQIEEPTMRLIRILDKQIDELAEAKLARTEGRWGGFCGRCERRRDFGHISSK